jgi:hypothetical protein
VKSVRRSALSRLWPIRGLLRDFDGAFTCTVVAVPETGEIVVHGTRHGRITCSRRGPVLEEIACEAAAIAAGEVAPPV